MNAAPKAAKENAVAAHRKWNTRGLQKVGVDRAKSAAHDHARDQRDTDLSDHPFIHCCVSSWTNDTFPCRRFVRQAYARPELAEREALEEGRVGVLGSGGAMEVLSPYTALGHILAEAEATDILLLC